MMGSQSNPGKIRSWPCDDSPSVAGIECPTAQTQEMAVVWIRGGDNQKQHLIGVSDLPTDPEAVECKLKGSDVREPKYEDLQSL